MIRITPTDTAWMIGLSALRRFLDVADEVAETQSKEQIMILTTCLPYTDSGISSIQRVSRLA